MKKEYIKINNIPCIIYGEKTNNIYLYIHGKESNKEEAIILADIICKNNYQVISFDLPGHGERRDIENLNPWYVKEEINNIINYLNNNNYNNINIFAVSLGAYFSLISLNNYKINKALFLSPILDMKKLIENMMSWENITLDELKEKKEIKTNFNETLSINYYNYVINNEIKSWNIKTNILYGDLDNLQDINIINNFVNKYNSTLDILTNQEHYFHDERAIKYLKEWINKNYK